MFEALSDFDPNAGASGRGTAKGNLRPRLKDIRGVLIGVPREFFFDGLEAEVQLRISQALTVLEGLGARLAEVSIPSASDGAAAARVIYLSEALRYHSVWLSERRHDYSDHALQALDVAASIAPDDLDTAVETGASISDGFREALQECDFVITPTVPVAAPHLVEVSSEHDSGAAARSTSETLAAFTRPINLTGLPSLSIPCGFTNEGMPVAFQLIGQALDEAGLFRVGQNYQQTTDWHVRRPPPPISRARELESQSFERDNLMSLGG